MTEQMADPATNLPNEKHDVLYRAWAQGGLGVSITGNVQVDARYLEAPRNVVLQKGVPLEPFRRWADAAKEDGCLAVMQISHAGRQCPASVTSQPLCPSAVPLKFPGLPDVISQILTRTPREITAEEIEDVIERFVTTAALAEEAGWDGVQIHSAHGYLLSSFLSPHTNRREDGFGGTAEKRRALLLTVVERMRQRVGKKFSIFVKLNSADFQRGGFTEEESLEVLRCLGSTGVDAVEISGGTYEHMEAMQTVKESTRKREAFFLDFAKKARAVTKVPLMLTGGFSSVGAMEEALQQDVDLIGLARPLCTNTNGPKQLLSGEIKTLARHAPLTGVKHIDDTLGAALNSFWHIAHMKGVASGQDTTGLSPNLWWILNVDMAMVYYWDPKRNPTTTYLLGALSAALAAYIGARFFR
eukprot:TRINITY_DN25367_c0_g1_i1.p1 TRINITY_DN25367_c0_g1~~TRINITY_DN25367_c0_g1_i1.p1  ORF type:complete len:463 (+),score=201.06 TRINITY_DN25367_c0_g1_i1:148-1389(+)